MLNDWMLTPKEICQKSTHSNCEHCTCKETGKPDNIPCNLFDNAVINTNAQAVKLLQHLIDTARKSKLPPLQKDSVTLANFIVMMESMLKDIQEGK